jgi:tRNA threonylcarbamoyl adenosine modification protein (Sua5/YciO/YrdC/YwlC family)
MSQYFSIHPDNPEARLLRQAAYIINNEGVIVYPTDSGYALGCQLGSKQPLKRIRNIRQLDAMHNMTLVCRDLSELGTYAKVNTATFRLLKAYTPGAYTFILNATHEVPRLMLHPKRRTLGLRIPDHPIALALLDVLDAPLLSTTLILPHAEQPLGSPDAIRDILGKHVDLIIDAGVGETIPTTVVDLTGEYPKVLRKGKGDPTPFL